MKIIFPLLIIMALATSCYYDSKEFLFPTLCDTTNVTYAKTVQPILQNNCYACHSNSTAANLGGSYKLENYADVKTNIDNGKILSSIDRTGPFPMPPSGPLDGCSINQIKNWINKSAPNN